MSRWLRLPMSPPSTSTRPSCTARAPEISDSRLDLPTPSGPIRPTIAPAGMSRSIPAKVSFVSATAQFTPKTVETASERQKLMFRIKARIDPELLQKHLNQVKTGLPGQAYVLAEPGAQWPAHLQVKLPE